MEEKVIHIPFNYNFFMESRRDVWVFYFKKSANSYYTYSLLAVIFLIIGWFVDRNGGIPFCTLIGVGLSVYMLIYWYNLYKSKKRYFIKNKLHAEKHQQESLDAIFTFSENGLQYQDKDRSYKMNWRLFAPLVIFRDNIFFIDFMNEKILDISVAYDSDYKYVFEIN